MYFGRLSGRRYCIGPVSGSGTTRIMANKLNRHAIGFELNPEYVKSKKKGGDMN